MPLLTKLFVREDAAFSTERYELRLILDVTVDSVDNAQRGCNTFVVAARSIEHHGVPAFKVAEN